MICLFCCQDIAVFKVSPIREMLQFHLFLSAKQQPKHGERNDELVLSSSDYWTLRSFFSMCRCDACRIEVWEWCQPLCCAMWNSALGDIRFVFLGHYRAGSHASNLLLRQSSVICNLDRRKSLHSFFSWNGKWRTVQNGMYCELYVFGNAKVLMAETCGIINSALISCKWDGYCFSEKFLKKVPVPCIGGSLDSRCCLKFRKLSNPLW